MTRLQRRVEEQHAVVREERPGEVRVAQHRADRVRDWQRVRTGRQESLGDRRETDLHRGAGVVVPLLARQRSEARRVRTGHRYQPPLTPMLWPVM